jgi:hypothetical protein
MGKQVEINTLRELSPNPDKFFAFEREVVGAIFRESDGRKEKAESARMTREKKAKRKRQRVAAGMG